MKNKQDLSKLGAATVAVHAGQEPAPGNAAIMTPIYQTATFAQSSPGVFQGYEYSRTGNPTRAALEENLAALEGGKYGLCFSSGLAASDAVMHLLQSGDHVVCCDDLYGGTFRLFDTVFRKFGIDFSFIDLSDAGNIEAAITSKTKMVWIETPTNPLLKLVDIEKLCEHAHNHNLIVVVDNTFASPYLQQPLKLGADIVLHSSTKYIGGHSDLIGGAVVLNDDDLSEQLFYLQNAIGAVPAPFECFLILRSTKTLQVRMERHCENAFVLAQFLSEHKKVEKVIYPGLSSHPQYDLAARQMKAFGGMISVVLKGDVNVAKKVLESLNIFTLAESLGGVESLAEHPAIMTHAAVPQKEREKLGITDSLIRLSVGIEDVEDLRQDLSQALG
ncbi:cystathionine gamma-synthase [Oligoflexia bacterium]|nr:cystathionine gamma-synthase [Oligoflexia bacterium]